MSNDELIDGQVLRSEGGFPCLHIPRPSLNRPGKPPSQEGSHRSGTSSEHSTQVSLHFDLKVNVKKHRI